MIINKAILHIFDFISEVCIFSQKEIDLREDNINEFIKKHIKTYCLIRIPKRVLLK